MSASQMDKCSIRGCNAPMSSMGIRIQQYLCERHLNQDIEKVRELHVAILARLEAMLVGKDKLRIQQQTLAVELQEVEELFDEAIDSLSNWKRSVTNRLTNLHDELLQQMRNLADLQDYTSATATAASAGDFRKVFELTSEMEIKCADFEEKFTTQEDANGSEEEAMSHEQTAHRVVGDVSGCLRDLQILINRQMVKAVRLCENDMLACEIKDKLEICKFQEEIHLDGLPQWIAACSNTEGFVSNSLGVVVKKESAVDCCSKLPNPCLFVLFHIGSEKDHLLLVSIDGLQKLIVNCPIQWSVEFCGLHCDSERQSIYIAQPESLTIADLSGSVLRVVNKLCLGLTSCKFVALDGNSDKVFLFEQKSFSIYCLSKDGEQLQSVISVAEFYPLNEGVLYEGMSALGNSIFLTDWNFDRLLKICSVSQQLIASLPSNSFSEDAAFVHPADVVAHRSGLIFLSHSLTNQVRVLQHDGSVLQTINLEVTNETETDSEKDEEEEDKDESDDDTENESHENESEEGNVCDPYGLAILDGDPPMLAVCVKGRQAIHLFNIRLQ